MSKILIISASVRQGRQSHRAALFFEKYIQAEGKEEAEIADLMEIGFPLFDERLKYQTDPAPETLAFAEKVRNASAVIIVTPEYNGGYPASLKNIIDLLYEDWRKKPIGICMVSDGQFGGTQVVTSLLFTLWKIGAWMVPAMFPTPKVQDHFDEEGNATQDAEMTLKRAAHFIGELRWAMEAHEKMAKG